ncbi:hypothetical protein MASR1M45_28430 [Candidatus Kapaibacterium sp.]
MIMLKEQNQRGMTLSKFQTMLLPRLEAAGWTRCNLSRLKVIYDTNMQMAYSQGKYRQQKLISYISLLEIHTDSKTYKKT